MGVEVVYNVIELSKEVKHVLSSQQLKMPYVNSYPHVLYPMFYMLSSQKKTSILSFITFPNFSLTNKI